MSRYLYLLLGALLFMSVFNTAERLLYMVMPQTFWVRFYDVTSLHKPYVIGEPLEMISYATYNRVTDIQYNDVLRCACDVEHNIDCDDRGFQIISTYISQSNNAKPTRDRQVWTYQSKTPTKPGMCYMKTTIITQHPQGVTKERTLEGTPFLVVPPSL